MKLRALITIAYLSLVVCGAIAIAGAPSPTLARQGGGLITPIWALLCVVAGLAGSYGAWRRVLFWELAGAWLGALSALVWTLSLILQGISTKSLTTASAACMGSALTALFVYRASRIKRAVP